MHSWNPLCPTPARGFQQLSGIVTLEHLIWAVVNTSSVSSYLRPSLSTWTPLLSDPIDIIWKEITANFHGECLI